MYLFINKIKTERLTAVSRNGEAGDLSEIGRVFNLKFCLYLLMPVLKMRNSAKPGNVVSNLPKNRKKRMN